jgi:hypothetical protein
MDRGLLEGRLLPSGSNLMSASLAVIRDYIDAGWKIGEPTSPGGTFLCTRGVARRLVSIATTDLGECCAYGASPLTKSPGFDERCDSMSGIAVRRGDGGRRPFFYLL